jgi:hypothetical protein
MVSLLGLGAIAVPAQAQTAPEPPTAIPIDAFCAGVDEDPPFPDITDESDFAAEIACLSFLGVTGGLRDGTYGAGRSVTRAQMASFMARMITTANNIAVEPDTFN